MTAATALPDSWKKPLVDSVVTPLHAQGSAPSFIQTISIAYTITGPEGFSSTVTPANTPRTHLFDSNLLSSHAYSFTPTVSVTPGIADTFTLSVAEVIAGGNETNFTPTTQTLAPSVNTGVIPFVAITGDVDDANGRAVPVHPDAGQSGLPDLYFLQVTLDEVPAGPVVPIT